MIETQKKNSLKKTNFNFFFKIDIFFFLIIINFLTYSIYAVLSKYNILIIEIIININFIIFFYLYKRNLQEKIIFKLSFNKIELIYFSLLLILLIFLTYQELNIPLFGDEIAPTRRATRTAFFSSYLFLNIFNIDYLKEIPFKFIIQFLSLLQLIFIGIVIFLLRTKKITFLIILLLLNFTLRYIIKDTVHHPPLNHIFSTTLVSFFGLNHILIRLSYLIPFWFFLILLYKLINKYVDKNISIILILTIATFPFLTLASVVPDHSIWTSLIFTYLLFYVFLEKDINYRFCVALISIGILFRVTIFSGFILIFLIFIGDIINKRFDIFEKIKFLFLKQKIFVFIMVFIPLFLVSILGTPAFEGVDNINPINRFSEALKSKIIIYSLIKQIPIWYYPFIFFIFFIKRKIEIIIFCILNLIIYFSIQPGLWGNAKYVLEYGVPFFILGYFVFAKILIDKKKTNLLIFFTIIIIIFNIHDIYKFPQSRISSDLILERGYKKTFETPNKNSKYLLKIPYSYDEAFNYIKKINAKKNTLLLGTTYGFYPEILENYNYNDLVSIINLRKDFDNINNPNYSLSSKITKLNDQKNLIEILSNYFDIMNKVEIVKNKASKNNNTLNKSKILIDKEKKDIFLNINKIEDLKYILLADYGDRNIILKKLMSQNWSIEKKFVEPNYRSTLILVKKN